MDKIIGEALTFDGVLIVPCYSSFLCSSCFSSFSSCQSFSSIIFESDSRLTRIESKAFSYSSLQSIVIPRNVELLCSSRFSSCKSLSSVTFESDSRLKRIEAHAFQHTTLHSVTIPPTVCQIACDAFPSNYYISVLSCNSCPELEQWCAERDRNSTVDFRRILRLSSGLPCLSECLLDLSVFERCESLGVANQGSCELYRRLSDRFAIVVKLIGSFDVEKGSESENRLEIQNEIEKLMNLKHPCVAALFGFVVSSTWTELKIVRAYSPIDSLEEALQTSPSW
jgi:hypothetical protein